LALLGGAALTVACSSENSNNSATSVDGGGTEGDGGLDPNKEPVEDDVEDTTPHALGRIALGEQHASGQSTVTPFVSVAFTPDNKAAKACTKVIAGCEIAQTPKCGDDAGSACASDETCTFDDNCRSVCRPTPRCDARCAADEECYLAGGVTPACRKPQTFDAGSIVFAGTTVPITLFPPYSFRPSANGAPFVPGSELTVRASGATGAGFEKFEEKFSATELVLSSPPLHKTDLGVVFGTGALPVGWQPGNDRISITLGGAGGAAVCKAQDSAGKFDVPREVIDAVIGTSTQLSVAVTREKRVLRKGKKTKGELVGQTIQPEGRLLLVTSSSESASFRGCEGSERLCGGRCVDVRFDSENCGRCGRRCTGSCSSGVCSEDRVTCASCQDRLATGTCRTEFQACDANSSCRALRSCAQNCTSQSCVQSCVNSYSSATVTLFNDLLTCNCTFGCATDCSAICAR
jgi:hypothetical protein